MQKELIKPIEVQKEELVCDSCGEKLTEDNKMYSEEQKCNVCETCESEDEPCLTIATNDEELGEWGCGLENDEGLLIVYVKHYSNDTGGEFKAKYVRTDGWRGYYDVIASKQWVKFHTDCILAGSEDESELKDFDEDLEEHFREKNIRFAKVFARTSNVFSTGYDFFVKREDLKTAGDVKKTLELINQLKDKYRDDERFSITAITGSSEKTKHFIGCY